MNPPELRVFLEESREVGEQKPQVGAHRRAYP